MAVVMHRIGIRIRIATMLFPPTQLNNGISKNILREKVFNKPGIFVYKVRIQPISCPAAGDQFTKYFSHFVLKTCLHVHI